MRKEVPQLERGEVHWANLPPPEGRRPVVILTRSHAIPTLSRITVAPITRTIRRNRSQVPLGGDVGLSVPSVANCDAILTVDKDRIIPRALGSLDHLKELQLDEALVFALAIRRRRDDDELTR